jgi:Na+/H+-dicarboxylate symporter
MSFSSKDSFRRLGIKTLLYYCVSCFVAICVGLLVINGLHPGHTTPAIAAKILGQANGIPLRMMELSRGCCGACEVSSFFLRLIPQNILCAAADNGQILGLILFSLMFGFFAGKLPPSSRNIQLRIWEGIQFVMRKITEVFIGFMPIGVFGLVTPILLRTGLDLIFPLLRFMGTIVLGFAIYHFVVLSLFLRFIGKVRPLAHHKAMLPVTLMAFSTASSAATLPLALATVEKSSRVSAQTANFTLPLGITINMSGTALYECVVVLFLAQLYEASQGIHFGFVQQITVVIMALLTSVGVAGIPSSGLISITMILSAVGLPLESVGVIWVVERVLDMLRTVVNVFNDTCGTLIIARTEGEETAYPVEGS